jgi:glycosyltransferase involved in cell wall biosynthesis
MHICMMNDNFYRSSGAAMAIRRISQSLEEVEYSVAACVGDSRTEDLSWVPEGRFERFDLKSSNPLRVLAEIFRLKKWLQAQGCELVHSHHRRIAVLLQFAGIPVLYTGHLVFRYAVWFRWLHPRLMTAVSTSVATNIFETTGRKTIACIGNPVHSSLTPPHIDLNKVKHKAVCVARLEPVKGHVYLLAAWKLLFDRGYSYELNLIGEGSLREELEAQVRRDGTESIIRFVGFTTNVTGFIDDSLFNILVSEKEGKPMVTLEAAAMGRASLVTAVPGSIDVIPPDAQLTNGVEFGNVEKLAEVLIEWFEDPEAVVKEGMSYFYFLKNSSDPVKIASQYKAVYQSVIGAIR